MYELKRIIREMQNQYLGNKTPVELESACADYQRLAGEALAEAERIDQAEHDTPQEMRDVFAAVAMLGFMIPNQGELMSDHAIAYQAWQMSDRMIVERANRIEARKVVQP